MSKFPEQTTGFLEAQFQQIRNELKIPREFPLPVLAEAEAAATRHPLSSEFAGTFADLRDVPFITLDPPGSRDLDQAFFATRQDDGYLVRYAIADVGFFVDRGSAVEQEAWLRGVTMYSPDGRTPLYPPAICENAASLLPDKIRPALVFTFLLNSQTEVQSVKISRAVMQSRAQLSYPQVGDHLAEEKEKPGSGALHHYEWASSLLLLEEIGRQRERLEMARGGISLRIPVQQVERWSTALTGYRLAFDTSSDIENQNAQISLMTGMVAAQLMREHQRGLLRVLDAPRPEKVNALQLAARALGVAWPEHFSYAQFVRSLDPAKPLHAVMLQQAAKVNGAARYVSLTGSPATLATDAPNIHAALAAHYAHVTAPLRRLADRYVLDLLVALKPGEKISDPLIEPLEKLPQVMMQAEARARQLETAIVDFAEAQLLSDQAGKTFAAVIVGLKAEGLSIQITDPPIRAFIPAAALNAHSHSRSDRIFPGTILSDNKTMLKIGGKTFSLGQTITIQSQSADPRKRTMDFLLMEPGI